SDSLAIIVYDSEWWVFPHDRASGDAACDCETEQQVIDRLQELLYDYQGRTVLLAAHHPMRTYGTHGGYYSWKDHLFPLTLLEKHLYLPMPGVGSLYPLLRRTVFLNPEDQPHPKYKDLITRVRSIADSYANLIHVAGHDHGLQYIEEEGFRQVASGAGSKDSYAKQGKDALFAHAGQGFVVLDYLTNRSCRITYYTDTKDVVSVAFTHEIPYHEWPPFIEQAEGETAGKDSVLTQANAKYDTVSAAHRKWFGENYRKEWAARTKLPVLRLSRLHGGLRPIKKGGGMQTVSLRLEDPT